jgi:RimJ/RimL family protein N-acetyltransferase
MLLKRFDIEFKTITSDDIELIRLWRNQDYIRLQMQYQQLITSQQQISWFNALDKNTNFYFLIFQKSEAIGLINLKNINWNLKEAEAGIFIGNANNLKTMTPFLATIMLNDFAFFILGLTNLIAKISSENKKAIAFNKTLGYTITENNKPIDKFYYYKLSQERYIEATEKLKSTIRKIDIQQPKIILTKNDRDMVLKNYQKNENNCFEFNYVDG